MPRKPKIEIARKPKIEIARNLHVIEEQRQHMDLNCDDGPFDEEDAIESLMYDCGMLPDGSCTKAGSEECDWECPFSS